MLRRARSLAIPRQACICDEEYIHNFQHWLTQMIQKYEQKHPDLRYPTMKHLLDDYEEHPIQHKNNQKTGN